MCLPGPGIVVTHQKKPNNNKNHCSGVEQTQGSNSGMSMGTIWPMINSARFLMAVFWSIVHYKTRVHIPSAVETRISHVVKHDRQLLFSESLCS